jgi:hypothetical protein
LFSGDIFEGDNADHSLFTSQHGQLAEISFTHQLFSFSDGLVFKAIDGFLIQFRLGELYLRIVAETPSLRLSSLSDTVHQTIFVHGGSSCFKVFVRSSRHPSSYAKAIVTRR